MRSKLFSFASQFFRRAKEISEIVPQEEKEELQLQSEISFQTFVAEYLLDFLNLSEENASQFYNSTTQKFNFLLQNSLKYDDFLLSLQEMILEEAYKNLPFSDSFDFLEDVLNQALESKTFQKTKNILRNYFAS